MMLATRTTTSMMMMMSHAMLYDFINNNQPDGISGGTLALPMPWCSTAR